MREKKEEERKARIVSRKIRSMRMIVLYDKNKMLHKKLADELFEVLNRTHILDKVKKLLMTLLTPLYEGLSATATGKCEETFPHFVKMWAERVQVEGIQGLYN